MKSGCILIFLFITTLSVYAQQDTTLVNPGTSNNITIEDTNIDVNIYPVPVRESRFTIKTSREVHFIRITNIIGQDIFRIRYNNPQKLNTILLNNPKRGMYLVTIIFSNNIRIVKKIMIEESE